MDSNEVDILEGRIKDIIVKIRQGHSRPCYQNILNFVNRGDIKVEMDSLKLVLNNLVERNVLEIRGEEGKESFFVNCGEEITASEEIKDGGHVDNFDNNTLGISAENFIQEKFHETLINMIKIEVKKSLCELNVNELSQLNAPVITPLQAQESEECVSDKENVLISALKSEISFLRAQMNSTNEIIKLLINDRNTLITRPINSHQKEINKDTSNKNNKNNANTNGHKNNISDKSVKQMNNNDDAHKSKKVKRSITVVGDSLIKDIKSFNIRKSLENKERVYVKSFPGATTQDMDFYIKPSIKHKPDSMIIHVGTNNLRSDESSEEIAENILKLAMDAKKNVNEIAISSIVVRDDDLYSKGKAVNNILKRKAAEYDLCFIDNNNLKMSDLNGSGLHLNPEGSKKLEKKFVNYINL